MTKTALRQAGFHQVAHFIDELGQTYHFPRLSMDEPTPTSWSKELYSNRLIEDAPEGLRLTGYQYLSCTMEQSDSALKALGSKLLRTRKFS